MLGRARRWVREQLPFLIVLVGLGVSFGFLLAEPRHPVRGTLAIAAVAIAAGLLRLALPATAVGMLAIRNRWVDAGCFLTFGALILATDIRLRH